MNAQVVALSYGAGTLMFALFTVLLLTAWRGRLLGGLLVLATAVSVLWCGATAANALLAFMPLSALQLVEVLRDTAWLLFLLRLLGYSLTGRQDAARGLLVISLTMITMCVGLFSIILSYRYAHDSTGMGFVTNRIVLLWHVLIAVGALVLVEQVHRNTREVYRGAGKFALIGIGGIFAFDLYMYSKALLFDSVDMELWVARGAVNALVVPLVAISAARNEQWSVDVFVSRHVVFHSAALLATGGYLMLMAVAGYYLRVFGGSWGAVAQTVFIFGALTLLVALVMSGKLRSQLRMFLTKHFHRRQYDYREEWLRFTKALSKPTGNDDLHKTIVDAIAQIVGSPDGTMWVTTHTGEYSPVSTTSAWLPKGDFRIKESEPMVRFIAHDGWIIFVDDIGSGGAPESALELPAWFGRLRQPWLVVPLMLADTMVAFVILRRPGIARSPCWEDRDLLKTVGQQAASHMALWLTQERLAEVRQFEAFNRLSAFLVHDLKNLVAQLSLVVKNAKRYLHTPGFMEDAIETVDNAATKMTRMLGQLTKGTTQLGVSRRFEAEQALREVVIARAGEQPIPSYRGDAGGLYIEADRDRFASVVEHIVQNAQEATSPGGTVEILAERNDDFLVVAITDTGCGMDADFISQRLFRPFDTTKGNAGMGVGVYETREFLKSLGGRVEVLSVPGKGSTFHLWVPLANEENRPDGHELEAAE